MRRPEGASDRDDPDTATKELEGRPLRSVEEMLNERLDQRDSRISGESGPNLSGSVGTRAGRQEEFAEDGESDDGPEQEPIDAES
jgi:hypothetical protein